MEAQTTFAERWAVAKGIKSDLADALEDEEEAVADYDEQLEEAGEGKLREDLTEIRDDEKDHARRLRRHLKRHVAGKSFADRWALEKSNPSLIRRTPGHPAHQALLDVGARYHGTIRDPRNGAEHHVYSVPQKMNFQGTAISANTAAGWHRLSGNWAPMATPSRHTHRWSSFENPERTARHVLHGFTNPEHAEAALKATHRLTQKWQKPAALGSPKKSFAERWEVEKSHVKGHYRQRGSKRSWVKPHERKDTPGAPRQEPAAGIQTPYRTRQEVERETSELFRDADVISTYTRKDALADGTLVDLTKWASSGPEGMMGGFKVPVAVTSAVWGEINDIPKSKQGIQDVRGRAHDVLTMAVLAARSAKPGNSEVLFRVIMDISATRGRYQTYKLNIGPGDVGEPVVTIMRPEED